MEKYLDFSQNGINIIFIITEENKVVLTNFSNKENKNKNTKWCEITDIHVSGENQNDHHGGKHTGSSGIFSLKYRSHNYYENELGNKLEFNLEDDRMSVTVHYQFYTGIAAIRCWTTVKNISHVNIGLEYISSFAFTGIDSGNEMDANEKLYVYIPHNSWTRELVWRKYSLSELGFDKIGAFSTKRINISNTGTWSAKEYLPMGVVDNIETHTTIMWQIENNGSWQWELGDIDDRMYLKLSGPNENENYWYKELKPKECFESVKVAVCVGEDFNSALKEMTSYRRKIVRKNTADINLPVIFNDYINCLWADPTEEKMIPIIDKAAEAGAEYYCMDAGWYANGTWWETVGEWQPCTWRFPNGIKKVFDYIRSKGMIPGIWLEIEVMGINCPLADKFEDECFFMRHGKRVIDHGRYQLDFRNEKVKKFADAVIERMVNEYGAGYIKMDYNIDAGTGTEVDSDSFGDGLLKHNRAYLTWIEGIMDKYPELIIENCSSGGMRMDYAMLSIHSIQSVTDYFGYKMAAISANAATGVLPEQAAVWACPEAESNENRTVFNMVNAMLQRIHLSGAIVDLPQKQFEIIKEGIECYKKLRHSIPEFIPFYPLGLNSYSDDWVCVGYGYREEVYLCIWRLDGDDSIEIPGVKNVNIIYPKENKCEITETEIGINIMMSDKYSAVVLKGISNYQN